MKIIDEVFANKEFQKRMRVALIEYADKYLEYFIGEYEQHKKDFRDLSLEDYYNGGWELDKENFSKGSDE